MSIKLSPNIKRPDDVAIVEIRQLITVPGLVNLLIVYGLGYHFAKPV